MVKLVYKGDKPKLILHPFLVKVKKGDEVEVKLKTHAKQLQEVGFEEVKQQEETLEDKEVHE